MVARKKENLASQDHKNIQQPGPLLRLLTKTSLSITFGKHMKKPTLIRRDSK